MYALKLLNTIFLCTYLQDHRLVNVIEIVRLVSALKYGKYIFHIPSTVCMYISGSKRFCTLSDT